MSRHNVRLRARFPHCILKNVAKRKVNDRPENLHKFTKVVMEKQALRERYIKLMNDAEKAFGRKEAIYLLRDAEIIWQKINSKIFSILDFHYIQSLNQWAYQLFHLVQG